MNWEKTIKKGYQYDRSQRWSVQIGGLLTQLMLDLDNIKVEVSMPEKEKVKEIIREVSVLREKLQ